jgi:hypothetical protein
MCVWRRPSCVTMIRILRTKFFCAAIVGYFAPFLYGCTPLYVTDSSITSTPRGQSLDVAAMASEPVALAGVIAPPPLQGFGPSLSNGLVAAIAEARPPMRAIPGYETLSILNEKGLADDYAGLISGYSASGILERQALIRIGSALRSHYLMLPGLAEFNQTVIDKFEALGFKLVRTRITSIKLWLQLWDARTGRIVWESSGEVTAVTQLLRAKRTVPVDELARRLWLQMIQEGLLGGKEESQSFVTEGSRCEQSPIGQNTSCFVLNSTQLYDPTTNTFTPTTASINVGRYRATATLLPNGKIFIVGGTGSTGAALSSTGLYDTTSNSFASAGSTASMNTPR